MDNNYLKIMEFSFFSLLSVVKILIPSESRFATPHCYLIFWCLTLWSPTCPPSFSLYVKKFIKIMNSIHIFLFSLSLSGKCIVKIYS